MTNDLLRKMMADMAAKRNARQSPYGFNPFGRNPQAAFNQQAETTQPPHEDADGFVWPHPIKSVNPIIRRVKKSHRSLLERIFTEVQQAWMAENKNSDAAYCCYNAWIPVTT